MITNLPREKLIQNGARLRGGHLLEQSDYTLQLAKSRGPEFESWLPAGFLNEAEGLRDQVAKALRDRTNMAAEAKDSTRVQNQALRQARVWNRMVAALGRMSARAGNPVPEPLTTIGHAGKTVPETLKAMQQKLGLLVENAKFFEAFPLYESVRGEGESLAAHLASVDATQENKRLDSLPRAVADYYEQKGRLYTALKMINDAGRAFHADSVPEAARFNLAILYRRPHTPAPEAPEAPAVS